VVIPGTSSRPRLLENVAAQHIELDEQAERDLYAGT
jgi:aryl-alcohol dehydrogenase-like predicted oxidoreductase